MFYNPKSLKDGLQYCKGYEGSSVAHCTLRCTMFVIILRVVFRLLSVKTESSSVKNADTGDKKINKPALKEDERAESVKV